jgi:hypothetical protein
MDLVNKATNFLACGLTGCAIPTNIPGMSRFEDNGMSTGLIIFLVIILILFIFLLIAVYRLTDGSWAHVILCFLFGGLYLAIAMIYYGFTGHKFCKVK